MSDSAARVLALPPSAIVDRPVATLRDVESTVDPDGVWVLGPSREPSAYARARQLFDVPVFHPPLETGDGPLRRYDLESLDLLVSRGADAIGADPGAVSSAIRETDAGSPALVCDDVTTTVRPTVLETTLGCAAELATLPADRETTVLTGGLPAGYDERWHLEAGTGAVLGVEHDPAIADGLERSRGSEFGWSEPGATSDGDGDDGDRVVVRVQGAGPIEEYGRTRSIATLALGPDGVEGLETHKINAFGLEAVSGVGPKTARRLGERGISTREDLLETTVAALSDLPGIGRERARTMRVHAEVLESGDPRRLTDDSLPGEGWPRPPLCLDVETDGLSPTIIWQVGVYDPESDAYRAFVERDDPTDPGSVLEAFCDWLLGIHPDRALLTWNGWGFDYRHLGAFVNRHVPFYADEWESIPKLDLYLWAVRNDNALLPGRTNKLEDVASALGYEGAGTGLDGAQTAAAYQRFVRTGTELEWDRHEAYCEDDCRALWHVYERLRDAPRVSASDRFSSGGSPGSARSTSRSKPGTPSRSGTGAASHSDGRAASNSSGSGGTDPTRTADPSGSEQSGLGDFG